VAATTVREAVRNRILYALLAFAVALIGTGVLLSTLSYVEQERILQDVGLAAIRLFGLGLAVFAGVGLLHREVERRTVHTVLSKPLTRTEFLLGKYAGLVATLWCQLAVMSLAFAAASRASGAPLTGAHAAALGLLAVELALVVGVATLFSSFTTPFLASLFSCGIVVAGLLSRELRDLGVVSETGWVRTATACLHRTLPDLEAFDLSLHAVHGLALAPSDVWLPLAYGAGYSACLLALAGLIFERRDFK
jgi:ABC-type transport system involved in multi-copper enzyme maturation permease subunit